MENTNNWIWESQELITQNRTKGLETLTQEQLLRQCGSWEMLETFCELMKDVYMRTLKDNSQLDSLLEQVRWKAIIYSAEGRQFSISQADSLFGWIYDVLWSQ